jgi:lipoyl(octanoyl) transferase
VISVVQLGQVDYATGLRLQRKLVDLRKDGRIGDVLLLLEHLPVITLGRNAKSTNVLAPSDQLAQRGVEVYECDRGGDVTFHGPGQLVGYPIFDLRGFPAENGKRKTLGVIEYVRRLEEVLIRTCVDYLISTERVAGLTGVWTTPESAFKESTSASQLTTRLPSKIAAIGVHISHGVTSHGFALNVNTDLRFFDLIVPCGLVGKPVTSIQQQLGKQIPLDEVAHSVVHNFGSVFHSQILWLEALDALLGEKLGIPARPPDDLRKIHLEDETRWA